MAHHDLGESRQSLAQDLTMPYKTIKTYTMLTRATPILISPAPTIGSLINPDAFDQVS
ncbi:MAG: hypothetical protein HC881_21795 [Leptolyngbyaceae cyanobacterium SL_7_1]|nr:hypothetical protein [Leptolyngbyaceae cyanobacterium SL_7_1]